LISPWFIDTGSRPVFPGEGNFQALNLYKDIVISTFIVNQLRCQVTVQPVIAAIPFIQGGPNQKNKSFTFFQGLKKHITVKHNRSFVRWRRARYSFFTRFARDDTKNLEEGE
jgi:hypothetical protein